MFLAVTHKVWFMLLLKVEEGRYPKWRCSARGRPQPDCLITRITWCTCELHKAETRETLAEETSKTGEAKDLMIVIKDETTEMEKPPNRGTPSR